MSLVDTRIIDNFLGFNYLKQLTKSVKLCLKNNRGT